MAKAPFKITGVQIYKKGNVWYARHRRLKITLQKTTKRDELNPEVIMEALANARAAEREQVHPINILGGLIEAYKASPAFKGLAPRTKKDYQDIFNLIKNSHKKKVLTITPGKINLLADEIQTKHSWDKANRMITTLSIIFNWALQRDLALGNPAAHVDKRERPKDLALANRPWTEHEFDIVITAAREDYKELVPALFLGRYTGLREGDVLTLPWSAYDGKEIYVPRQRKTGKPVEITVRKALKAELDRTKKRGLIIVLNSRKKPQPYTESGFRSNFHKLLRKLKAEKLIGNGLTFHGLRHTVATEAADRGVDAAAIGAMLGHEDDKTAKTYTRAADRKKASKRLVEIIEENSKTKEN